MIRLADCVPCANDLGLDPVIIQAVARVESNNDINGFLFEPHVFSRLTEHEFDKSHPHISYPKWDRTKYPRTATERYRQFDTACKLNEEITYQSTSWGLFQIMGFHYKNCFYDTAKEMATDLKSGVKPNVDAFCEIVRKMGLIDNLRNKEWEKFARVYNGPSYRLNSYDVKMAQMYTKLKLDTTSNIRNA